MRLCIKSISVKTYVYGVAVDYGEDEAVHIFMLVETQVLSVEVRPGSRRHHNEVWLALPGY